MALDPTIDSYNTLSQVEAVVAQARAKLFQDKGDRPYWNYGANLGIHFLSQYYLMLNWIGWSKTSFDTDRLRALLIETQLADGGWYQVRDLGLESGDIDSSIFNYWALKAMGEETNGPMLTRARQFILQEGGIEKAALFTKTFLSLFGNYDWRSLTYVPYLVFVDGLPSNYRSFAKWVAPNLMPMSYLRHTRANKDLGDRFEVEELWASGAPEVSRTERRVRASLDGRLIEKMLTLQQPRGSWGGYTVSTILSAACLTHYQSKVTKKPKDLDQRIDAALARGFNFLEWLYTEPSPGAYLGALMDGQYWDSLLIANAILDSSVSLEDAELKKMARDMANLQQPNGGLPYGLDFELAPDVDDTAQAVLLLSNWPEYKSVVDRSVEWLHSMQNDDGGWGAFDKNNVGNPFLKLMSSKYEDSVELFDDSSADSSAHVIEALATAGHNISNSETSRRGVSYLKSTQKPNGAWTGRWAINTLFGTTCAIVGLVKAGEEIRSPYLQKALDWLESKQNADGGFGETSKSYKDPAWEGRGQSTPSQTAWVLWALVNTGRNKSAAAKKAADHLLREFRADQTWFDRSVTGTGHPGLLNMNYPSYARAFPLIALAQYLKSFRTKKDS